MCRPATSASAAREIGYMFGQYKTPAQRIQRHADRKGPEVGRILSAHGSDRIRPASTSPRPCSRSTARALKSNDRRDQRKRKRRHLRTARKRQQLGAKVVALSDSNGYVYDPNGIQLDVVKDIKEVKRGRIKEYAERVEGAEYHEGYNGIWTRKMRHRPALRHPE